MAITEDEAHEYRVALNEILSERGLSWIVQQADERIALGKTTSRRLPTGELFPEALGGEVRRRRGRTAEFLATEPFNELEKLEIMLDALDLGLVSPPKMEQQMLENIALGAGEVQFVDEAAPDRSHGYRTQDLAHPVQIATALAEVVRKIRDLL
jgi:hypothetical protein